MRVRVCRAVVFCMLSYTALRLSYAQQVVQSLEMTHDRDATVEQFREYLALSGVGEIWRAGWIASLDPNWKRVAAPYWPKSFEDDLLREMKQADLAPSVWSTYHSVFSKDRMSLINALLRNGGVSGYLASSEGKSFCVEWAVHEEEGKREILGLTTSVFTRVYERDQPQIKTARAAYLKKHPNYKD